MGMRKKLMKGMAYGAAPKLAFAAFNPRKAAFAKAAGMMMDHLTPEHHRRSRRTSNLAGFGAAAVAIPVGIWLGRRFFGSEEYHVPMR